MTNTDDMYVFTLTHYKCTYSHLHIIRPFLSLPFTYTFLNVVLLKMANSRIQIIFIIKDEFRFLPNLDLRQKRASQQNCIFFFFFQIINIVPKIFGRRCTISMHLMETLVFIETKRTIW